MAHDLLAPWAELVPDAPYPMTAADLAKLPKDGWHYELVRGRVVRGPLLGGGQGIIAEILCTELSVYARSHQPGYVLPAAGFRLAGLGNPEQNIYAPTVSYIELERAPARDTPMWDDFWELAPDLVAEVVSPDQHRPEMAEKARDWLTAGARLVWVVWPKTKQVDVWLPGNQHPGKTLKIGDALDGLDVVPGFTYPLAELFA